MANRKSWRRAAAPQSAQPTRLAPSTTRNPPRHAPSAFPGLSDPTLSTMLSMLVAQQVTLRAVDGAEYNGLFSGTERISPAADLHLLLQYARIIRASPSVSVTDQRGASARLVRVPVSVVSALYAAQPDFEPARPVAGQDARVSGKPGFATDAQISRGNSGVGRQLQRFDDFAGSRDADPGRVVAMSLDEQTFGDMVTINGSRPGRKWDQFQVNEDKFGVKTSFDEDEYTTKIDRNDVNFRERQIEAARLASEIEAKTSDNVHMREERNQEVGADYDEEALYSGVQRPESNSPEDKHIEQPVPEVRSTTKPAVTEKPKLSYAAAAAVSVKANSAVSAPVNANMPGAAKQAPVSKPTQSSKQGSASKLPTTAKQTPAPKQANAPKHLGSKQFLGGKQTSGTKQATTVKQPVPTKQNSGKQLPTSKPLVTKPQALSKQTSVPKNAAQIKQNVSRQPPSGKQQTSLRQPSAPKQAVTPKPVTGSKQLVTAPRTSSAAFASGTERQPSYSSAVSKNITESREREANDKKSKTTGARDRSSRENLPALAKVRSGISGRTSPNQTRNSPLATPADSSAVAVLNLDAQTPNLGPEQIKRFEEYKTDREIQSIAENREKITDDLKKFRTQLDSRNGQLRRGQTNSSTNCNSASIAPALEKKIPDVSSQADMKAKPIQKTAEPVWDGTKQPDGAAMSTSETAANSKPKLKSKLNPNAQEFKFNPDAPSFEPTPQPQPTVSHVQQTFNPYPVGVVPAEYSQPMQSPQQGYPVPVQAMGQIPYGQPPYGVIIPGTMPAGIGPNNSAYQFMQAPPGTFPGAQVAGRFAQSGALPTAYPYPQMNPGIPVVIAQPQRVPSGPYAYYSSGPYPGGQVPGAPQMPPPVQQPVYAAGSQQGVGHIQGGMGMTGRGGHGHVRRGGGNRRVGKHHNQHSHGMQANGVNSTDKGVQRTTENTATSEMSPR